MTTQSSKSSYSKSINDAPSNKAKRGNIVMSAMVELGLKIMRYKSVHSAAQFLTVAGVPLRVIIRVLLRPDLRRNLGRYSTLR